MRKNKLFIYISKNEHKLYPHYHKLGKLVIMEHQHRNEEYDEEIFENLTEHSLQSEENEL